MTSESDLRAFVNRLRELLAAERKADLDASHLLLSKSSPRLLEQKGLALLGLAVVNCNVGLGGKTLIELERPSAFHTSPEFPPHSFRNGDLASISDHNNTKSSAKNDKTVLDAKAIEGVVYKVTSTRLILAVDKDDNDLDLPTRQCKLVKLANTVTFDRMDRAVDALERIICPVSIPDASKPAGVLTDLLRVLFGLSPPSAPLTLPNLTYLDPSLNDSQKSAVQFALSAQEVACIHGPPGTGKTHTLVEIIRQLVAQGKRVLVCGASNLAVDNLLERLVQHAVPLTRIGHPARVLGNLVSETLDAQAVRSDEFALAKDVKNELEGIISTLTGSGKGKGRIKGPERKKMWDDVRELRKEYRKREGVVVKRVVQQAKVVLATCHSAGGRQIANEQFDVVVIDEATQAMEPVCYIPIMKAKKLILAGDPCQLPPTVISTGQSRKQKEKNKKLTPKPAAKKESPAPQSTEDNDSESDDESQDDEETEPQTVVTKIPKAQQGAKTLRPLRSLETTIFDRLERMYGAKIKKMLTVQYRMHERIADFPSKALYAKALRADKSVAKHLLRGLPGTSEDPDLADVLEVPVVFFDTAGCEFFERVEGNEASGDDEGSKLNENEATVVQHWVGKLVEAGVQPAQIAVITPYQAQVAFISSLLKPSMPEIEIGTVDGMQGREKEAVILTLVRSNDKREVGFLKEKRRLNVAMTRARRHLCVVGDSSTIEHGSGYLKKWMKWLEANADVRYAGMDS